MVDSVVGSTSSIAPLAKPTATKSYCASVAPLAKLGRSVATSEEGATFGHERQILSGRDSERERERERASEKERERER
eukprot:COSAG03_NODE_4369_length_1573_cov_6.875848_2_plen_77_part_01